MFHIVAHLLSPPIRPPFSTFSALIFTWAGERENHCNIYPLHWPDPLEFWLLVRISQWEALTGDQRARKERR